MAALTACLAVAALAFLGGCLVGFAAARNVYEDDEDDDPWRRPRRGKDGSDVE